MTGGALLPVNPDGIPPSLQAAPRWLLWRLETRQGKRTKVPYQVARPATLASSTDPATWCGFGAALAATAEPVEVAPRRSNPRVA